jgi:hypothetical protein
MARRSSRLALIAFTANFSPEVQHMQKKLSTSTHRGKKMPRSVLTLSGVLLFLVLQITALSQPAPQQTKKAVNAINIYTRPGSYPILIDGKPAGRTATPTWDRTKGQYTLPQGTHTIEIRFPNNHRWKKEINSGNEYTGCHVLTYTPRDPKASNANPIPPPNPEEPLRSTEVFDVTFPDGAKVGSGPCLMGTPVPNVPLNSRKPKRKSTRKN